MNPEAVQTTYEAITNPILRLMIYFLAAAVVGLGGAVIFLYRERQALQQEMLAMNREAIEAMNHLADAFEGMQRELAEFRHNLTKS